MAWSNSLTTFPTFRRLAGQAVWVLTLGRKGNSPWATGDRVDSILATLPAPLAGVVADVCRRARLWPSERSDVARELASHFRDGLEAGASEAELRSGFGDVATAAKLIRRAKRRHRPLPWKLVRGAMLASCWVLAGLIGVYALLALRYFTGEPTLSRNFVQEFNQALAQRPIEQQAWPLYKNAILLLPPWPQDEAIKKALGSLPDVDPSDEGYSHVLEYNRSAQPALEIVRRAAMLAEVGVRWSHDPDPDLWRDNFRRSNWNGDVPPMPQPTTTENPDLIGVLIPHLGEMRRLARHLSFDARVAASERDGTRALANIRAILGMSRQLVNEPNAISQLVALALATFVQATVADVLRDAPDVWSDDQLVELAHDVAAAPRPGTFTPNLSGERLMFADVLQRVYTDNGNGDGRLTPQGVDLLYRISGLYHGSGMSEPEEHWRLRLIGPLAMSVVVSRAHVQAAFDRYIDAALARGAQPPWTRGPEPLPEAFMSGRPGPLQKWRYIALSAMAPAMEKIIRAGDQLAMTRDATGVIIAMHLYRREHDRWPETLEELRPRLLPAPPIDIYDGSPLRYIAPASPADQPRLYSIGPDLVDHGGIDAPSWAPMRGPPRTESDEPADWVFWPRAPRPQPLTHD